MKTIIYTVVAALFTWVLFTALTHKAKAEILVLTAEGGIIATHSESQEITKANYPNAAHILTAPRSVIQYDTVERTELDLEGNLVTVTERINPHLTKESLDAALQTQAVKAITVYAFPMPLLSETLGGDLYNPSLAKLVAEARTLGSQVKTNLETGAIEVELYNAIAAQLPQDVQDAIAPFKQ